MQIFIKTLIPKRTITVEVEHTTTIQELKELLVKTEGLPINKFYLINGSRILEYHRCLSDYIIKKESTITMILKAFS